tara:strand:- start:438 stop:707 length:270 start_codon:yes stop_codon:yes gene_type:complete
MKYLFHLDNPQNSIVSKGHFLLKNKKSIVVSRKGISAFSRSFGFNSLAKSPLSSFTQARKSSSVKFAIEELRKIAIGYHKALKKMNILI